MLSEPKMERNNINRAMQFARKAIEEDKMRNYPKAIELYQNSITYFERIIFANSKEYQNDQKIIQTKIQEYSQRVEKLKNHLISKQKRISKTRDENLNLENTTMLSEKLDCKICLEIPKSCWILSCGHLPFCEECSQRIFEEGDSKCPICRMKIEKRMRAYF